MGVDTDFSLKLGLVIMVVLKDLQSTAYLINEVALHSEKDAFSGKKDKKILDLKLWLIDSSGNLQSSEIFELRIRSCYFHWTSFIWLFEMAAQQGTFISAVTFNQNVAPLDALLVPFKRYEITNADLNATNPQYRIGEYAYEWVLKVNHLIQEIHDEVPHPLPCTFNLTKFSDLSSYAEREEYINLKGLVVGSIPVNNAGGAVRDYIIINEEKIPLVLRSWEDFLDNDGFSVSAKLPEPTLVIGFTLKVTTFHGLSLSTAKFNTCFLLDPPLSDAQQMHSWFQKYRREIAQLIANKAYDNVEIVLPPPKPSQIRRIKDVTSNPQQFKASWVAGKLELMPAHDQLWQSICNNCKKYVKAKINWKFTCNQCNKYSQIIVRGRMEVYLSDDSGALGITIFPPYFEKITGMEALDIYEADLKGMPLTKQVETTIQGKKVYCFIKFYKAEKNYTLAHLYTETDILHLNTPVIETESAAAMMNAMEEASEKEPQFFTPSIKSALEATTIAATSKPHVSDDSPTARKTLLFGSITAEIPGNNAEKEGKLKLPAFPKDVESPVKKSKKKEEGSSV